MISKDKRILNNLGITLIALIITIIILLILAGVTIITLTGENSLLKRANQAVEETKYADAKENLELMLIEIKMRVISEEKRNTLVTDCDELKGKDEVTKVEYINQDNSEYALVTYRNYIFKIDDKLNIVEDKKQENDEIVDDIILGGGKYIYNKGIVSEEAKSFIGANEANSEYSINENNLYMNIKENQSNTVCVATEQKVNLSNYTKLKCLVSTGDGLPSSGNWFYLTLNDMQLLNVQDMKNEYNSKSIGANQTECILEFEIPDECFNKEFYIGAVGTLKDVYIYKIWLEKSETKMLYDNGIVSQEAKGFVGVNAVNSSFSINNDNLFMTTKQGDYYNAAYIGTENKIDLTDYRRIRCLVTTGDATIGYSGNYFGLALHNEQLPDLTKAVYKMSNTIGINKKEYCLSFVIPDECKNANYYVGVCGCIQNVYVYKIWLEK